MVGRAADLTGRTFGRLTVIAFAGGQGAGRPARWFCRCSCGGNVTTTASALVRGQSTSCGCYRREQISKAKRTHGESSWKQHHATPEYSAWHGMIGRCHNQNDQNFRLYGERGIVVCARWRGSFEAFLADVGRRPSPTHSIDRIDSNGNYEPGNVRWATVFTQNRNRRTVSLLTIDNEPIGFSEVARILAMPRSSLRFYFRRAGVLGVA